MVNERTITKLLELISLCVIEKIFLKDILCHVLSIPHLVIHIHFANWVITTLREIIFWGTKFSGMFIHSIKLPRKYRGKKFYPAQKNC